MSPWIRRVSAQISTQIGTQGMQIATQLPSIALVAVLYFLFGHASFMTTVAHTIVTPVFFASEGIALAAIVLFGRQVWVGIFIGQLALALSQGMSWEPALAISAINSLEALLGLYLIRRWNIRPLLDRTRDFGLLMLLIFCILQPLTATLGIGVLWLNGIISGPIEYLHAWQNWWMGNSLGQSLVTPLLLVAFSAPERIKDALHNAALPLFLLAAAAWLVFGNPFFSGISVAMVIFVPILFWIADRGGVVPVSLGSSVIVILAIYLTGRGSGPFVANGELRVLDLDAFVLGIALFSQYVSVLIEERRSIRTALSDSEQFARNIIDSVPENICVIDKNGVIVTVNEVWRECYRKNHPDPLASDYGIGHRYLDVCHFVGGPDALDAPRMAQGIHELLNGKQNQFEMEYTNDIPNEKRTFTARVTRFQGDSSNVLISHENITERKRVEAKIRESEARYRLIAENSHDIIWSMDLATMRFSYVSPSVEKLRGFTAEEVMAKPAIESVSPESQKIMLQAISEALERINAGERHNLSSTLEVDQPHRDGHLIPTEVVATLLFDETGQPKTILGISRDISERRKAEEILIRLTQTDELTGLANRRHFMQSAEQELARAARYGGDLSLMMMDIDHFKKINDTYGHQTGDLVIQAMAKVCRETLRECDIIGRIGGEEFAIVLPQTAGPQALEVAERLRQAIADTSVPMNHGKPLQFTASIGVAVLGDSRTNVDTLLGFADSALYEAKGDGRNLVRVHI